MDLDIPLVLIQFVALALPAVGIYMEIAYKTRQDWLGEQNRRRRAGLPMGEMEIEATRFGHSYHLARTSILSFAVAGLFLLSNVIIRLPPDLPQKFSWIGVWAAGLFLYGAIFMIGIGLIVFASSVALHQVALKDDMGIIRSIEIVQDHSLGGTLSQFVRDFYRRIIRRER